VTATRDEAVPLRAASCIPRPGPAETCRSVTDVREPSCGHGADVYRRMVTFRLQLATIGTARAYETVVPPDRRLGRRCALTCVNPNPNRRERRSMPQYIRKRTLVRVTALLPVPVLSLALLAPSASAAAMAGPRAHAGCNPSSHGVSWAGDIHHSSVPGSKPCA
jgi:hypothetical protein